MICYFLSICLKSPLLTLHFETDIQTQRNNRISLLHSEHGYEELIFLFCYDIIFLVWFFYILVICKSHKLSGKFFAFDGYEKLFIITSFILETLAASFLH